MKAITILFLAVLYTGHASCQTTIDSLQKITHCTSLAGDDMANKAKLTACIISHVKQLPVPADADCLQSLVLYAESNCDGLLGNWHLLGDHHSSGFVPDGCEAVFINALLRHLSQLTRCQVLADVQSNKIKVLFNAGQLSIK